MLGWLLASSTASRGAVAAGKATSRSCSEEYTRTLLLASPCHAHPCMALCTCSTGRMGFPANQPQPCRDGVGSWVAELAVAQVWRPWASAGRSTPARSSCPHRETDLRACRVTCQRWGRFMAPPSPANSKAVREIKSPHAGPQEPFGSRGWPQAGPLHPNEVKAFAPEHWQSTWGRLGPMLRWLQPTEPPSATSKHPSLLRGEEGTQSSLPPGFWGKSWSCGRLLQGRTSLEPPITPPAPAQPRRHRSPEPRVGPSPPPSGTLGGPCSPLSLGERQQLLPPKDRTPRHRETAPPPTPACGAPALLPTGGDNGAPCYRGKGLRPGGGGTEGAQLEGGAGARPGRGPYRR